MAGLTPVGEPAQRQTRDRVVEIADDKPNSDVHPMSDAAEDTKRPHDTCIRPLRPGQIRAVCAGDTVATAAYVGSKRLVMNRSSVRFR
jgi:hypothetical protein